MLYRAGIIAALILALISPVIGAHPAHAQDAPPAVNAALAALNAQLGANLTLDDLDSWQWTQRNFPDRSLDCPVEGYTYPQFSTNGTIVLLVYNGVQYDFRVYTSNLQVFQCTPNSGAPGGVPADSATQSAPTTTLAPTLTTAPGADVPAPTPPPTNTPDPVMAGEIVCAGGLPVRLAVGMRGRNIASGSINIRQPPDLDDPNAVKGLLLPGAEFDVIGGPQCADNRTWWEIRYESAVGTTTGWVIEGDNVEYWLEPVNGAAAPQIAPTAAPQTAPGADTREPVTVANAAQLRLFSRIPVQVQIARAAFLPPPAPDALIIDAAGMLHYYAGDTVVRVDLTLNHAGLQVQRVATGPKDGTAIRFATLETGADAASGVVLYVSEIANAGALSVTELFGFQLPHLPNALTFSPDGRYLAASSGSLPDAAQTGLPNLVWLWDADSGQQLPTIQLDGPAADLAFSPDGAYLAVAQPGVGVQILAVESSTPLATLFNAPNWHGTPSLAWSPDGSTLAAGTTDGRVILYDVREPANAAPLRVLAPFTDAEVRFVAFNATGSLLATGGVIPGEANGAAERSAGVMVWDAANGTQLVTLATDSAEPLTALGFRDSGRQLIATGRLNWWTWGVF